MFNLSVPDWNQIPALDVIDTATINTEEQVQIPTSAGILSLTFYPTSVRLQSNNQRANQYNMLSELPPAITPSIQQDNDQINIRAGDWKMSIGCNPFCFELFKSAVKIQGTPRDGHFVREFRLPPMARTEQGWLLSLDLTAHQPVYGLGEKWGRLDKRGQLVRSYNHDALGVNAEISYKNTPFAWSPLGWGLLAHTPAPVTHAVGYAPWSQRAYVMLVEDDALDVFLIQADDGAQMLANYRQLTGAAPVPPDWSLGLILSKAYYKDADELLHTAREVRAANMPCDTITLDGRAWQDTDTRFAFEWDKKRYPNPKIVLDELKSLGFKVCIWEYPMVSVNNPLFTQMAEKGWLLKDKRTGDAYRYSWDMQAFGEVLTPLPQSGIVDFTHPDAYQFWHDQHKALFDIGVDMIKADFGEQVEDNNMLAHNGESGLALHNVYSLLYNRCVYEAAASFSQHGPFLFSRSAWTGSQRYPSQWGGDPQADWGGFAGNIRGGISWGLSGGPYYATDVGGFYKDKRDDELYVRWIQAAIFSAHMRLHGIGQREPWSYDDKACHAANRAIKLRYQLLPYIKNTLIQSSKTGLPVQRAMVLAFPDQPQCWGFEDQFMFGDDMLIAPCFQPGGKVQCYLPAGQWLQFNSAQEYSGEQLLNLELALEDMAVFVRKGARIPLGASMQCTSECADISQAHSYWPA